MAGNKIYNINVYTIDAWNRVYNYLSDKNITLKRNLIYFNRQSAHIVIRTILTEMLPNNKPLDIIMLPDDNNEKLLRDIRKVLSDKANIVIHFINE